MDELKINGKTEAEMISGVCAHNHPEMAWLMGDINAAFALVCNYKDRNDAQWKEIRDLRDIVDTKRDKIQELQGRLSDKREEIARLKDTKIDGTIPIMFMDPYNLKPEEWISVKSQLPEMFKNVIVWGCIKKQNVMPQAYQARRFTGCNKAFDVEGKKLWAWLTPTDQTVDDVTNWMPMVGSVEASTQSPSPKPEVATMTGKPDLEKRNAIYFSGTDNLKPEVPDGYYVHTTIGVTAYNLKPEERICTECGHCICWTCLDGSPLPEHQPNIVARCKRHRNLVSGNYIPCGTARGNDELSPSSYIFDANECGPKGKFWFAKDGTVPKNASDHIDRRKTGAKGIRRFVDHYFYPESKNKRHLKDRRKGGAGC